MSGDFFINLGWINLVYLFASILFILGIRGLTHPRTAVRGNLLGAAGMLMAVAVTMLGQGLDYRLILTSLALGSAVGAAGAIRVSMNAMPQMVALLNGFGGAASTLVTGAVLMDNTRSSGDTELPILVATVISGAIGALTFWGSLVAFGKLQGVIPGNSVTFLGQKTINITLAAAVLGCGVWVTEPSTSIGAFWVLCVVASLLGVGVVVPIGGADMPVVIALLNSYSGLAAAATGFILSNNVLIIAGSLVGASGMILTNVMCKSMNRSLVNVLFGVMASGESGAGAADVYEGRVKSATTEEVAMLFDAARRVVIVPGYGMAVAQAQHTVRDLANVLQKQGCQVEYAIHPVAGRMPGHMNVLLAEADVPYDQLVEMDAINPTMQSVDVALVIGANDVVNPDARLNPNSPIAGMPIINVDNAKTVVVVKRSLSPGFAGIPNPLFAADNTLMYFGDGKKAIQDLVLAVKQG